MVSVPLAVLKVDNDRPHCLREENLRKAGIAMKRTNPSSETEIEVCDVCHHHHPHFPASVPDDEVLYRLADLFKVFGDPTRIRILYALSSGELCVCDIAQLLGMTQSAISHQLRVLKQMALVKFRRDGKTVYYSLADAHVATILAQGLDHVQE